MTAIQRRELAQARRFITLQAREHTWPQKLKMHERAMMHLYAFLKGETACAPGQGRLL